MIITKQTAECLIARGEAKEVGQMYDEQQDLTFCIVNNFAEQRTDHYVIGDGDLRKEIEQQ